jgi:hypothetical protein
MFIFRRRLEALSRRMSSRHALTARFILQDHSIHLTEVSVMSKTMKLLGLGAGVAAIAASAPASAQYYGYPAYGYSQPGYAQPGYGQSYAYGYGVNTGVAQQQCTAAVQSRLYNRQSIGGVLGVLLGANTTGRVVGVTQVNPRSDGTVRVRGIASSGRYASNGYGPYGVGAYGAMGYGYANAADLSFRCDVAPNGAVYNVSINRRY